MRATAADACVIEKAALGENVCAGTCGNCLVQVRDTTPEKNVALSLQLLSFVSFSAFFPCRGATSSMRRIEAFVRRIFGSARDVRHSCSDCFDLASLI
mmetsp:Transcript_143552/g.459124  ORF Transcript_143552/g.459124 Transcript_143552/m.459124 type:complete len:98 (-) Transcript_143552:83-376(-)